jgi:hypothetical protein
MGSDPNKIEIKLAPSGEGEITRELNRRDLAGLSSVDQLLRVMDRAKPLTGVELAIRSAIQTELEASGGVSTMIRIGGDGQPIKYVDAKVSELATSPSDKLYVAVTGVDEVGYK